RPRSRTAPLRFAAWRPLRSLSSILGSERTAAPTAAVGLEEFIGCSGKKLEPGFVKDVQLGNLRFPICAFRSSHRFGTPILFLRSKHHGGLPVCWTGNARELAHAIFHLLAGLESDDFLGLDVDPFAGARVSGLARLAHF